MGRFLNMGNEKFAELAQTKYFVELAVSRIAGKLYRRSPAGRDCL